MRSLVVLLAAIAAVTAFDVSQKPLTAFDGIPGKNPVSYCEGHPAETDILTINYVDLTPNPPNKGEVLKIEAEGKLSEPVEKGAYAMLLVKYGYIKIVETKVDLCDQINNVNMECPLKPGPLKIVKEVQLPKEIPPGTYNVHADVFTVDQKQITCLVASVKFG